MAINLEMHEIKSSCSFKNGRPRKGEREREIGWLVS